MTLNNSMLGNIKFSVYVLLVIVVLAVWLISSDATVKQREYFAAIENKYNFTSEIITTSHGGETVQALSVVPEEDGELFEAGFHPGDIILSHSKVQFYTLLHGGNGGVVEIVSSKDASAVDKQLSRKIILKKNN
jgi:hypothetical protein